ncbi:MAG: hypothetical protein QOI55_525 [Actinomycetota bacterium]|nr:hypothetical protein [Actinomycetota bacterium]
MRETLERVVACCDRLVERVDEERSERRTLAAAIDGLARSLLQARENAVRPAATNKVIGGSFFGVSSSTLALDVPEAASPATPTAPASVIDIRTHEVAVAPDRVVEVRCRFGDRWVDGFEVCELIADDERVRYRLRRTADGSVLPTLFDADDVREMRGTSHKPAATSYRRWSQR